MGNRIRPYSESRPDESLIRTKEWEEREEGEGTEGRRGEESGRKARERR